ncbi:hypothetical protein [Idiomarina sp.]|uniref:hypothetical protein n=1 Tax=Idiomarina sp. TaxID=1874361 RepID=UPI00258B9CF4|nr:hypothetical protein [Idiomarina sp.]
MSFYLGNIGYLPLIGMIDIKFPVQLVIGNDVGFTALVTSWDAITMDRNLNHCLLFKLI